MIISCPGFFSSFQLSGLIAGLRSDKSLSMNGCIHCSRCKHYGHYDHDERLTKGYAVFFLKIVDVIMAVVLTAGQPVPMHQRLVFPANVVGHFMNIGLLEPQAGFILLLLAIFRYNK